MADAAQPQSVAAAAKGPPAPLRLLAEDEEDLAILAAALQDAIVRVGDIEWEPHGRRLTVELCRFCWEADDGRRVRAGLQLGGVLRLRERGLPRDVPEAMLDLLTLEFQPGEAPGGALTLRFAGGGDLRAEVECVDVALADFSAAWAARRRPRHAVDA